MGFFDNLNTDQKRFIATFMLLLAGAYVVWGPDLIPDSGVITTYLDDIIFVLGTFRMINNFTVANSPRVMRDRKK